MPRVPFQVPKREKKQGIFQDIVHVHGWWPIRFEQGANPSVPGIDQ